MSCNGIAHMTPPTLEIVTLVTSGAGRCQVDATGSASHDIEIRNWGGRAYSVDIHGECQTPCIRYQGTDGCPQESWDQNSLLVQSYPGSGARPMRATASKPLMSCGAARAQSIRTNLRWVVPGWPITLRNESLGLQVDTV